ncbi:hypothetical protein BDP55DRAFT_32993 [Colletotrichum godetiae]|uniref:Uncharacterized protein n=1 Tax=Colletotrichum godetiae TaxID=1209918 RepID=A0AAJ0EYQ1_9PEZI|nr:uncharacterized protein BDP55DRAFT_32993 [Colletotrichum godetiae]KAK1688871.1 hypothetical protein BDP55DRAFT_32993 [Colletotrichum godetiae]
MHAVRPPEQSGHRKCEDPPKRLASALTFLSAHWYSNKSSSIIHLSVLHTPRQREVSDDQNTHPIKIPSTKHAAPSRASQSHQPHHPSSSRAYPSILLIEYLTQDKQTWDLRDSSETRYLARTGASRCSSVIITLILLVRHCGIKWSTNWSVQPNHTDQQRAVFHRLGGDEEPSYMGSWQMPGPQADCCCQLHQAGVHRV